MFLPILVIIPLGFAFLLTLIGQFYPRIIHSLSVLAGFLIFFLSLLLIGKPNQVYFLGGWKPPFGICMVFDGLSLIFLLIVNFIGFMAIIYSKEYILKRYKNESFYYPLFFLLLAGLNGVVLSGDIFNLYVFLEIASIASYALVAFGTEAEELEASFKYLILGSVASGLILLGIALIFGKFSTLNMADIAQSISEGPSFENMPILIFILSLLIAGFALKAGLVPFHTWLADAHPSAPAPVSAMLSGVVIKALGIYGLSRLIFNVFGFSPKTSVIFTWLGIISMTVGVLLAIGQWDFKRLLAYHSISQIGYVVFGLGLGTPLGIAGGLFHLFNHSIFKSLLFLNAGAVEYKSGSRNLKELNNFKTLMPQTWQTSLIASFSIAGIPPFCGFWSKLMIIIAALQIRNFFGALICIFVSLITLASFLKVQNYVFLRKTSTDNPEKKEVGFSFLFPMWVLALSCIFTGIFFIPVTRHLIEPAVKVLIAGKEYINFVLK